MIDAQGTTYTVSEPAIDNALEAFEGRLVEATVYAESTTFFGLGGFLSEESAELIACDPQHVHPVVVDRSLAGTGTSDEDGQRWDIGGSEVALETGDVARMIARAGGPDPFGDLGL